MGEALWGQMGGGGEGCERGSDWSYGKREKEEKKKKTREIQRLQKMGTKRKKKTKHNCVTY